MLFFSAADVLRTWCGPRATMARDRRPTWSNAPSGNSRAASSPPKRRRKRLQREDDFSPPSGLSFDLDLDIATPAARTRAPWPSGPPRPAPGTIRFRPTRRLFVSGNEPLHLLRALAALGEAESQCDVSAVPPLDTLDADNAYLAWTIRLVTEPDREIAQIEEVFEFVEGLCDLAIEDVTAAAAPAPADIPPVAPAAGPAVAAPDMPRRLNLSAPDLAGTDATSGAPEPAAPAQEAQPALPEPAGTPPPADSGMVPVRKEPTAGRKSQSAQPAAAKATVRVDLDRIDRLVNLVGELVINQAMLAQSVAQAGLPPHSDVMTGLEELQQLTRDIQDSVMMIRAQPVKSLFQRMSRIVREASAAIGKTVRLDHRGRKHRGRQDRDRTARRSADPHDPQRRRPRT